VNCCYGDLGRGVSIVVRGWHGDGGWAVRDV
jgi:hypothetical protein